MKWCPCVKQLAKESCQFVSVLMPTANFVNLEVQFYEKRKQNLVILSLQQFKCVWYTASTPTLKTGWSAVGLKGCLWQIDLWGQLRSICCSGHSHDCHTTEERGRRRRRLWRIRGLYTSGLPCCCYSGSHSRCLPDILRREHRQTTELPLKEHFTIYEERTWISTHMKPESEECYQISYWNILYTWSFH